MIKCHIELGHYELAIKKCDQLKIKNHKMSFKILIKKLLCLLKLNQLSEAQKLAENLFKKNPNSIYLIILTAFLYSKQNRFDHSKATYYKVITKNKNSKIKLSCALMLIKQLLEQNDYYSFNEFFELFKSKNYFDEEVSNNNLFQAYKLFSNSLKNIFLNEIEKASKILEKLCLMLNGVDVFLEKRILSFMAYCQLILKNFEKTIQIYKYKEKKFGLTISEQYNLKMSLVVFNSEFNQYEEGQKFLEGIQDIFPARIDTGIFKELLKIQKIKNKIPELIEINRFNSLSVKKEKEDLEALNVEFFETLQSLEEIVINNNKNAKLFFLIALTKITIGLYNEALENLNILLNKECNFEWKVYFWRGVLFLELRDFLSAIKSFSECLKSCPEKEEIKKDIIKFKAFSCLRIGEYERAKLLLEDYIDKNSKDFYFVEILGDIEFLEMKYNCSYDYYKSILHQSNSKERILFKILLLQLFQQNLPGLIKTIEKLFSNFNKSSYQFDFIVLTSLGFLKKKNYKKAISTIKKLKKIELKENEEPIFSNQYYYIYLGVFYFFDSKFDKSKQYFEKAIFKLKNMKDNYLKILKKENNNSKLDYEEKEVEDHIIKNLEEQIEENRYNSCLCDLLKGDYKKFKINSEELIDRNLKKKFQNILNLQKNDNPNSKLEIRFKTNKNQIQNLFEYEIIDINGYKVVPILDFHWPEPEFKLENIDYSSLLVEELNVEKFGFEPIFPWITLSGFKNILITRRKEENLQTFTFKYSSHVFDHYQKNTSIIPQEAMLRLQKVFK